MEAPDSLDVSADVEGDTDAEEVDDCKVVVEVLLGETREPVNVPEISRNSLIFCPGTSSKN